MASLTPAPLFAFRLNAADILRKLDSMQSGMGNATREPIRGAMVRSGLIYFEDMRARFDRASGGDGTWQPLAPSTLRDPRKRDKRILRNTGRLFASLTPGNNGARIQVFPDKVSCSIVSPAYAAHHQNGTSKMPQRKILDSPSNAAKQRIFNTINAAASRAAADIWRGGGGGSPAGGGNSPGTNRSAA